MDGSTYSYYLVFAGVSAVIYDLIFKSTGQFMLLVIGLIGVASGVLGIAVGSFMLSALSASALLFLYLSTGRKYIRNFVGSAPLIQHTDKLVGETVTVIHPISQKRAGQVLHHGESWRAVSSVSFKKGDAAIVKSVSGVTLELEKKGHPQ
jgi:membrane protein implicated in regulation of membrane protease activity